MKKSSQSSNGTSYHFQNVYATPNQLKQLLGEPDWEGNDGEDKVNFDWVCETSKGDVFTVYDWKEYRVIGEDENIEFHIGGHDSRVTELAAIELKVALNSL